MEYLDSQLTIHCRCTREIEVVVEEAVGYLFGTQQQFGTESVFVLPCFAFKDLCTPCRGIVVERFREDLLRIECILVLILHIVANEIDIEAGWLCRITVKFEGGELKDFLVDIILVRIQDSATEKEDSPNDVGLTSSVGTEKSDRFENLLPVPLEDVVGQEFCLRGVQISRPKINANRVLDRVDILYFNG